MESKDLAQGQVMESVQIRDLEEGETNIRNEILDQYALISLPLRKELIADVKKECELVTGKNTGYLFESLLHNAVVEFLKSDLWDRIKDDMIEINNTDFPQEDDDE